MPPAYFRQVPPQRRDAHLRAIISLAAVPMAVRVPEVQLRDTSGKGFTFISHGPSHNSSLNEMAERQLAAMPAEMDLRRVLLFQSMDGRLGLNVFDTYEQGKTLGERRFGDPEGADTATVEAETAARVAVRDYFKRVATDREFAASEVGKAAENFLASHRAVGHSDQPTNAAGSLSLADFLSRCSSAYVVSHAATPWLLYKQMELYEAVAGADEIAVTLDRYEGAAESGEHNALLTLAIPATTAREAMRRAIHLLNLHGMELQRAQVDTMVRCATDGSTADHVTLLRTVVRPLDAQLTPATAEALVRDAARLQWVSDWSFSLADSSKGALSLLEAEVTLGLADLSLSVLDHPLLSRQSVRERLYSPTVRSLAVRIANALLQRFDPDAERQMSEEGYEHELSHILRDVEGGALGSEQSKQLLRAMVSAAQHTLRTNVHVDGRWALSFRLDPRFFEPVLPPVSAGFSNVPFGTFFVAGRHFNGFHNRFRDIARGGLRVVLPPNEEAHSLESRRHFMECFGLSWAQQLKNKDIPEGGSKGVCLVTPQPGEDRSALMHGCVQRMADAMLDLLVPSCAPRIVTRAREGDEPLGDELIYLGPDENITPRDLDWIVGRAAERGYAMPSAFMSSKPRAGINHKEFGVTSEGVAVFLGEALRSIGIRPELEPWSIKLTGGPDGDVAGNMLKILQRDYGQTVRVVGLADGTATAEDPDGLPMPELLRLVHSSSPLCELDRSRLGSRGVLTLADTPAGIAARNTMHSRVVADAFVPAGGRPATMNAQNWRDFLQPDGTPSARVVVEGANLFLTPEARLALFEACALPIVKDSSANKCGVICSSMEIRASMSVSDDDFVAMKAQYVDEVLAGLREMAQLEASLLFSEANRQPSTPLPAISERISFAILRVADALAPRMDAYASDEQGHGRTLWPLVAAQLPAALALAPQHAARLPARLPWEYQKSTIVKSLASRLVYREGLSFVEGLPDERLSAFALAYLEEERRVAALADAVGASAEPYASEAKELLLRGGVRVAAEQASAAKM